MYLSTCPCIMAHTPISELIRHTPWAQKKLRRYSQLLLDAPAGYMGACIYACTHVCMHVCMYVCVYARIYVCQYLFVYMFDCLYVCLYVYMYGCTHTCTNVYVHTLICACMNTGTNE